MPGTPSARTHATAPAPARHASLGPDGVGGPHSTTGAVGAAGDPGIAGAASTTGAGTNAEPQPPSSEAVPVPAGPIGTPFLRWESLPDDALDPSIRPLV